ncbi:MAG: helix-turn-helix transcriptional regulator [Bacteroidota bacterium]|jgi:transcriptional regulator with XRE-family HTH domain
MKKYASRLRKIRISHEYSQEYVALKLGIAISTYSKLEQGKTELTLTRLVQLSEILQFNLSQFFDEEPEMEVSEDVYAGYGFVTRAEFVQHVDKLLAMERQLSNILSQLPQ